MNILIISMVNPFKTSGVVAYNLYKGLKNEGSNTKLLIKPYGKYNSKDIISMETSTDVFMEYWKHKLKRILNRLGIINKKITINPDYQIQEFDQTVQYYSTKKLLKKIKFKPDAIIYLFQQKFLNAKNLYELNKLTGAKIFWYLMDTAPLTGACHYSWDCKGYMSGCGKCPALYSANENDQSAINFNYKKKYLTKTDIDIIASSEWLMKKALASLLFKDKRIHKVLLSIDPNVYTFVPKIQAKEKLGIPVDKKVIFFGAISIILKRKGMKYLIDALQILKESFNLENDKVLLLIAGNFDTLHTSLPYEYRHLGLLENNEQLASAYQAADVFVCPSIEDAGPMMINQSLMCGTPVVSFQMGAAEDLVLTGETGYSAKLFDSADLCRGISYVLSLNFKEHEKMCSSCRSVAINSFTLNLTAERIMKLLSN